MNIKFLISKPKSQQLLVIKQIQQKSKVKHPETHIDIDQLCQEQWFKDEYSFFCQEFFLEKNGLTWNCINGLIFRLGFIKNYAKSIIPFFLFGVICSWCVICPLWAQPTNLSLRVQTRTWPLITLMHRCHCLFSSDMHLQVNWFCRRQRLLFCWKLRENI